MRLKRILRQGGLFHMVRLRVSWPTLASAHQPLGVASRRQSVSFGCIQLCFWRSCNPRLIFYHFQPSHVVAISQNSSDTWFRPNGKPSIFRFLRVPPLQSVYFLASHTLWHSWEDAENDFDQTIGLVSNVSLQGGERCTGRKGRRTATDTGWFNETQKHLRFNQFLLGKG